MPVEFRISSVFYECSIAFLSGELQKRGRGFMQFLSSEKALQVSVIKQ